MGQSGTEVGQKKKKEKRIQRREWDGGTVGTVKFIKNQKKNIDMSVGGDVPRPNVPKRTLQNI